MRSTTEHLPDGSVGTEAKLARMTQLIGRGKRDPAVRQLAARALQGVPERAWSREIDSLHRTVRASLRYTMDPDGVEWFQDAGLMASGAVPFGDCDDHCILLGAMLESVGHPARLVAGGFGDDYGHVWLEVLDREQGGWRALDPIAKDRGLDFDPSARFDAHMRYPAHTAAPAYGGSASGMGLAGFNLSNALRSFEKSVLRPAGKILRPAAPLLGVAAGALIPGVGPLIGLAAGGAAGLLSSFHGGGASALSAVADAAGALAPVIPGGSDIMAGINQVLPLLNPQQQGQPPPRPQQVSPYGNTYPYGPVPSQTPVWLWPAVIGGGVLVLALVLRK